MFYLNLWSQVRVESSYWSCYSSISRYVTCLVSYYYWYRFLNSMNFQGYIFPQASSNNMTDYPFVVFPHWNLDQLLMPVFDSLRALEGLLRSCLMYIFPWYEYQINSLFLTICLFSNYNVSSFLIRYSDKSTICCDCMAAATDESRKHYKLGRCCKYFALSIMWILIQRMFSLKFNTRMF